MDMFQSMYDTFKGDATFYLVYIQEAHASDGWFISDDKISLCYREPTTIEERMAIATDMLQQRSNVTIPMLVDLINNNTNIAYAAKPERIYIIEDGIISYKGGPGPFGFVPEEAREWLEKKFPK